MSIKNILRESLIIIAIAAALYFGIQSIFQQRTVEQTSMTPTLIEGERIFINRLADSPDRGDIIVFKNPDNPDGTPLVKRVIGLPGEQLAVRDGFVYVDGEPLTETYIREAPAYTMSATLVPEGQYFVLGDNRNGSRDSHYGWTVPQDDIIGTAWLSVWPLDHIGLIPDYAYADE